MAVPKADLWALESGSNHLEPTVRVLRWMVGKEYTVAWIDADGKPWVDVLDYPDPDGGEHSIAIMDGDTKSWVRAESDDKMKPG